ncbi:hypothetical protein A9G41_03970 [Gilliamella sp. Nev5-1]|nr:hypothetical protein A9G40_06255 [Gilliamella apicola]OCG71027.1 hypothetical protein A9G41_03970 [Gilliamella apicola]
MSHQLSEQYPINIVCALFAVSRTAFYNSRLRPENKIRQQRRQQVEILFKQSRDSVGSRTITTKLNQQGIKMGRYKVRELMKEAKLYSKKPKVRQFNRAIEEQLELLNKLSRNSNPTSPNQVWTSDITYIWAGSRWIYLAIVADLYVRRVVGYSVSDKADSQLVISALDMAWPLRGKPKALMFHSDQGCQYLSAAFRHCLSRYGIVHSVSRRGNCWDNAPTECLFRSLKSKWIPKAGYRSLAKAKSDMFCYLFGYYNQRRPHSFNAGLPPAIAKQPKLVFKNT